MATGAFGQGKNEAPMFQFTCHLIRVFYIMGRNGKTRRSTPCPPPHRRWLPGPAKAAQDDDWSGLFGPICSAAKGKNG